MKYRICQVSHIDDAMYGPGLEGRTEYVDVPNSMRPNPHVPGPHWEPLDDEAKAMCLKHGIAFTGSVPDPIDTLSLKLADAMQSSGMNVDAIAAAISKSLAPILDRLTPSAADEEAMQRRVDEAVERALASRGGGKK